jgi:histone-lysine N-methyltransferase SETMAR
VIFAACGPRGREVHGEFWWANLKDPEWKRKKSSVIRTMHPPTKVAMGMGKLRDLHFELLEHPPYSPDLAPSDFCLFPKLKLFLVGERFSSNRETIAAVEGYFAYLTKNHYRDGIMALEHRWSKCISLMGDYVEK